MKSKSNYIYRRVYETGSKNGGWSSSVLGERGRNWTSVSIFRRLSKCTVYCNLTSQVTSKRSLSTDQLERQSGVKYKAERESEKGETLDNHGYCS